MHTVLTMSRTADRMAPRHPPSPQTHRARCQSRRLPRRPRTDAKSTERGARSFEFHAQRRTSLTTSLPFILPLTAVSLMLKASDDPPFLPRPWLPSHEIRLLPRQSPISTQPGRQTRGVAGSAQSRGDSIDEGNQRDRSG